MALRKGEEWEANGTLMRTTPSPALISEESRAEEARLNAARGATGRARSTIAPKGRRWREEEDKRLRIAVQRHGGAHWKEVAAIVGTRNHVQCLQRWRKVLAPGLVKGCWSEAEDAMLSEIVRRGFRNWGQVATQMKNGRTSKQCRERWRQHLDTSICKKPFSLDEDMVIIQMRQQLGNQWSTIARHLPGRTDSAVKIRWKVIAKATGEQEVQQHQQHQSKAANGAKVGFVKMASQGLLPGLSGQEENGTFLRYSELPTGCDDNSSTYRQQQQQQQQYQQALPLNLGMFQQQSLQIPVQAKWPSCNVTPVTELHALQDGSIYEPSKWVPTHEDPLPLVDVVKDDDAQNVSLVPVSSGAEVQPTATHYHLLGEQDLQEWNRSSMAYSRGPSANGSSCRGVGGAALYSSINFSAPYNGWSLPNPTPPTRLVESAGNPSGHELPEAERELYEFSSDF